jgi:hypothetical protein
MPDEPRNGVVAATAAVASFGRAPQPVDKDQQLATVMRHLIGAMKVVEEMRQELKQK